MRHLVSEAFYKNAKLTRSVIQRVWEFPTCKRLDENSVPGPACQVVKRVKIVIKHGQILHSWEQRKLSDLVDVCSGRDYKHLSEGTIPVYGTGGYMLSVSEALSYDRDAIGIGRKGTIDKPYVLKAPFWTVDTLFYAVPKHPECLDFIHDIFQIIDWKKKDESTGVPSLSKEAINDTDVMVPKIDEQLITGDVFARIDNLITLHQCKYLMFPAFSQINKSLSDTLSWEQRKLSELAEIVGGGTPDTNNSAYWDGDIDWYAPAEMEGQRYAVSSVRKITELGLQKSSAKMLPAHRTVLFTSRAGIGKMAILQRPAATNQGFQSLVLRDGIDPYFIYSMGDKIKGIAEGVASGSTFLEISGKMLGSLEVMTPSIEEQKEIASFFRGIDDLITLHQREQAV